MRSVSFMAVAWLSLATPVHAQSVGAPSEAQSKPPTEVCLTNACGPSLAAPKPTTVRQAIAGGNAMAVRDLGGSPAQAMEAIMQRLAGQTARSDFDGAVRIFGRFADTSDGSTLSFVNDAIYPRTPPAGLTVVGGILRRAPDGSAQMLWLTDAGGAIAP